MTVTVNDTAGAPPAPTASGNPCGPQTLTRSGSPPSGVTWYWQGLSCDERTDLGSGTTFTATESGTYYIRARSDAGCWSDSCGQVAVTVNPVPPTPVNVSADPDHIYIGETLTLSASVSGAEIDWYMSECGGDFVDSGDSIDVSPVETTTYYARARYASTGCVSDDCGSVTVSVADCAFTIGGAVYTDLGNPLASGLEGVTVIVACDPNTYQATTFGLQGLWFIEDVPCGSCMVTPSLAGYTFQHVVGGVPDGQPSATIDVNEENQAANQSIQFLATTAPPICAEYSSKRWCRMCRSRCHHGSIGRGNLV